MAEPSCSVLAADEPLAGTAPYARGWIILERAEPWGRDALSDSGLAPSVVEYLTKAQRELDIRFLAARRSIDQRRRRVASGPRSVWLAFCDPLRAHTHHTVIDDPEQMLEWDLEALAAGVFPSVGEPIDHPIQFVCTHSRRDACCAVFGRAFVAAIPPDQRSHVWECSHLGGHRFAATSLFLPTGRLYGRLTPEHGSDRFDGFHGLSGAEPSAHHLRGPCYLPEPLQAAECRVRVIADVTPNVPLQVIDIDADPRTHGRFDEQSGFDGQSVRARVDAVDGRWWLVHCRASTFTSAPSCGAEETTRTTWQANIVESSL